MPDCTTTQKTVAKLEFLITFFLHILFTTYTTQYRQQYNPQFQASEVSSWYGLGLILDILLDQPGLINQFYTLSMTPTKLRRTLCQCEEIACLPFLYHTTVRFLTSYSSVLFILVRTHTSRVFPRDTHMSFILF